MVRLMALGAQDGPRQVPAEGARGCQTRVNVRLRVGFLRCRQDASVCRTDARQKKGAEAVLTGGRKCSGNLSTWLGSSENRFRSMRWHSISSGVYT
jgi:hypothetical protein